MKTYRYILIVATICSTLLFVHCTDADDNGNVIGLVTCSDGLQNGDETGIDCGGSICEPCAAGLNFSGTFTQEDQIGRPGINTVFGTIGMKDAFNLTIPSEMQAAFQSNFQSNLLALNPDYTTNALGLDATAFTTLLSNDVLWVAETGITTYFNGTEVLTGRALTDDVIDVSLLLIFGGPAGMDNPTLISDFVSENDASFSTSFPYLANPF
ncbi:MAG: DUF4331 family protein [Flavobacteriales bacterium]